MNILIAEDDLISRKLLQSNLEQMGYGVSVAKDGEEAWEMFNTIPYRVVVSDWLMPKINGLDLCHRVRERPDTDYTYFILLTANTGSEQNYLEAMDAGVDDFLSKPLDRQQLQIRLRVAERILKFTSRIQSLENIVTICAYTKQIKMPDEDWKSVEQFIDEHLGIKLSHGIHPDYYQRVIQPEIEKLKRQNSPQEAD